MLAQQIYCSKLSEQREKKRIKFFFRIQLFNFFFTFDLICSCLFIFDDFGSLNRARKRKQMAMTTTTTTK